MRTDSLWRLTMGGVAYLAVAVMPVPAQQFGPGLAKRHFPFAADSSWNVALGDLDGDGDLDAVFVNRFEPGRVLLNEEGQGRFEPGPALPNFGPNRVDIALGDVDGDADLDLVVARERDQNLLLLNDGSGSFAAGGSLPVDADATAAVVVADVDADFDLDIVFGNVGAQDRLYLNDGSGHFADATATNLPTDTEQTQCLALGDVTGDGEPDLVLGNMKTPVAATPTRLYVNDGDGRFTDVTATHMPALSENTQSVALGDVDGDRDLDLVLGNAARVSGNPQNSLYLNDGSGRFADATAGRLPAVAGATERVRLADVDGDLDLDLVSANSDGTAEPKLYLNDGGGFFADETTVRLPIAGYVALDADVGDVDGDGDLDLVYARFGHKLLYLNDGAGLFVDATAARIPPNVHDHRRAAVADVDGDGDVDLVLTSRIRPTELYLNDGLGTFENVTATHLPSAGGDTMGAGFGDVDGDGDPDLALTRTRTSNQLFLNDGSGRFTNVTATHMPSDADWSVDVAFADVDGDRALDLLFANSRSPNRLYMNDGAGRFTDATTTHMPASVDDSYDAGVGDLDGDGDPDVVFCGGTKYLLINDGSGRFADRTSTYWPAPVYKSTKGALGDVDGDGDLDLYVGVDEQQDRLFLNDGAGRLTDVTTGRLPVDQVGTTAVAFVDVDLDGDADVVAGDGHSPFAGPPTDRMRLYLNDGSGWFGAESAARLPPARDEYVIDVLAADLDSDGDADLVVIGTRDDRVLTNRLRHIDVPWVSFTGGSLTYEVAAEAGFAAQFHVAVPMIATARAWIPLPPYGVFGLDPATAVLLPPVYTPPGAGVARASLLVPDDPALRGLTLYLQAVILGLSGPAKLTNVVGDTIR